MACPVLHTPPNQCLLYDPHLLEYKVICCLPPPIQRQATGPYLRLAAAIPISNMVVACINISYTSSGCQHSAFSTLLLASDRVLVGTMCVQCLVGVGVHLKHMHHHVQLASPPVPAVERVACNNACEDVDASGSVQAINQRRQWSVAALCMKLIWGGPS